jgi:two-component system, chemotaxis family, chemotaxis protein CheY
LLFLDTSKEQSTHTVHSLLVGETAVGNKRLIVEDSAQVREMLAVALGDAGFIVVTADDGYEGLACARRERPDLILTDIEMPNLDGICMIERLRQEPELSRTPVLVLSAVNAGRLAQAAAAGATSVMEKPVRLAQLISTIRQTLGMDAAA